MKTTFRFALLLSLCVAYATSYPSNDDYGDTDDAEALHDFETFLDAFIQQEEQQEEESGEYAEACVYCMKLGCHFYLDRDFLPSLQESTVTQTGIIHYNT